jgi:hypothetical protein
MAEYIIKYLIVNISQIHEFHVSRCNVQNILTCGRAVKKEKVSLFPYSFNVVHFVHFQLSAIHPPHRCQVCINLFVL